MGLRFRGAKYEPPIGLNSHNVTTHGIGTSILTIGFPKCASIATCGFSFLLGYVSHQ